MTIKGNVHAAAREPAVHQRDPGARINPAASYTENRYFRTISSRAGFSTVFVTAQDQQGLSG